MGIFFIIPLFSLLDIRPVDRKSLFVLPAGMLLYTALGMPIAYLLVPDSPIDLRYHLAHGIVVSAFYRPIFMGSIAILPALIYITLYRSLYRRIPVGLRTEVMSLSWREFRYPDLLFSISMILDLLVIL